MREEQLVQLIEAALFVADKPLSVQALMDLIHAGAPMAASISANRVKAVLEQLVQRYENRGVQLVKVASGYRFQSRAELGELLALLWQEKPQKYSQAMLETLALIAYRQPITRGDIEDIRGVSVSSQIMKTLQERGWVKVVGHREVPGRPQLYATTAEFLDYFNLADLSELPEIPARAETSLAAAESSTTAKNSVTAETATNVRVH